MDDDYVDLIFMRLSNMSTIQLIPTACVACMLF